MEHGHDLSYKSPVTIHQVARPIQPRYWTTITTFFQDLCRENYPQGRLCSASRMAARHELDTVMRRYRDTSSLAKMSTPSGELAHSARQS